MLNRNVFNVFKVFNVLNDLKNLNDLNGLINHYPFNPPPTLLTP